MEYGCWVNGELNGHISPKDRGFSFGDGVFETIKLAKGQPLLLGRHLDRLFEGARRLSLPLDAISLIQQDLAKISLPDTGVLKLSLSRGEGGRGYAYSEDLSATRVIQVNPLPHRSRAACGAKVIVCDTTLGHNPLLAGMKHLNRLEQVLARQEVTASGADEGITLDFQGKLVEGVMSNLFWAKRGVVYTPDLSLCGVKGVVRSLLIDIWTKQGIDVQEGFFTLDALLDADEVFVTNSLIDIWPVIELAGTHFSIGPMFEASKAYIAQEYNK